MEKYKMGGEIKKVQDLLDIIQSSGIADTEQAHIRNWFRGHADATWNLRPGVYRSDFPASNEDERLKLEQHLTQDFRVMSVGIRNPQADEPELYFLQQHYRMRTRLLDWSNNALAGLYFAVSGHPQKDGALYFMDAYAIGPTQRASFKENDFFGVADSRHPVFQDALHTIFWWQAPNLLPEFLFPVRPDFCDKRITLQRGCFTFHVPNHPELTSAENTTLTCSRIPSYAKVTILKELALLGIDGYSIFGDLDHLSDHLKSAYKIP